jgi:hypothetical protein
MPTLDSAVRIVRQPRCYFLPRFPAKGFIEGGSNGRTSFGAPLRNWRTRRASAFARSESSRVATKYRLIHSLLHCHQVEQRPAEFQRPAQHRVVAVVRIGALVPVHESVIIRRPPIVVPVFEGRLDAQRRTFSAEHSLRETAARGRTAGARGCAIRLAAASGWCPRAAGPRLR